MANILLILLISFSFTQSFNIFAGPRVFSTSFKSSTSLNAIPLELTGQLDATKTWDVKFIYNGEERVYCHFLAVYYIVMMTFYYYRARLLMCEKTPQS